MDARLPLRWRTLAVIALNGLALGLLGGLLAFPAAWQRLAAPPGSGVVADAGAALVGGPFQLRTHLGTAVNDTTFAGRPMLVAFGYTRDGDYTPATLQKLSEVLRLLDSDAGRVAALFVTLDPDHDTPAVLAANLSRHHPQLVGLTGTRAEVAAVAKAYRLPLAASIDPSASPAAGPAYEPLIFLMNRNGSYVTHMQHNLTPDTILAIVRTVL